MSRARTLADYGNGIDTASITSGTLADGRIPSLGASKITSGTFATARIADDSITLDKLAHLGTDGHVLTSTGTGSAPAFEAVSAGTEVLLNTYTADNSSTTINIEDFSGTYDVYKIVVNQLRPASDSVYAYWFLTTSGGDVRSSGYRGVWQHAYYNGSGSDHAFHVFQDNLCGQPSDIGNVDGQQMSGVFWLFNAHGVSRFTQSVYTLNYQNADDYEKSGTGGARYLTAESHNGVHIVAESGNWQQGIVKVYGLV